MEVALLRLFRSPHRRRMKEIEERTQRRRHLPPARIVQIEAWKGRRPLLQHAPKLPGGDEGPDLIVEKVRKADAVERRADRNLRLIDDQRAFDRRLELLLAALELPAIEAAVGRPAEVDAAVPAQIARRLGHAEAFDIGW